MERRMSAIIQSTSDGKDYTISYAIDEDGTKNVVIYVTNDDGIEEMVVAFDGSEFTDVYEFIDNISYLGG